MVHRHALITLGVLLIVSASIGLTAVARVAAQSVNVHGQVRSSVDPNRSDFFANPSSVPANGIATSTLTVVVVDGNFAPLPNKFVTVDSSRDAVDLIRCYNGPILTMNSFAYTDANGRVVCLVSSTNVGQAVLTATADSVILAKQLTLTFTAVPGAPPSQPPTEPPFPAPETPPPPGVIQRIIDRLGDVLDLIPPSVPGGLGLAVLVPTLTLLIPLGSSISISALAGIPALQYLLFSTFPALRPPKRWGTVRDATTNVPVPGVFVDLIEETSRQRIKRVMTDRTGRFGFLAPAQGRFWVEIKNALYEPWRSESFDVKEFGDKPISFDISLRPLEIARALALKKTARYMKFLSAVRVTQNTLLISGSIISVGLFAREQNLEHVLLIAAYTLLWVLHFISSLPYTQSGRVFEKETENAVNEAVVQVTALSRGEQEFIHSTISDDNGRFLVLVPPGQYAVIAAKPEYAPTERIVSGEIQNVRLDMERIALSDAAIPTTTS